METLDKFKHYLLNKKNASKITVKNYVADVRKFIRWFEITYQRPFAASIITEQVAKEYTTQVSSNAPRSVKRYTSSLKKFFSYLKAEGSITINPFETSSENKEEVDPWHLKEFKNYLYFSKASKLTIKNYMIDVQQFLNWVYQISKDEQTVNTRSSIFGKINAELVEEYKNRLLDAGQLSPVSVNRKLSSLRKYVTWSTEKGLLQNDLHIAQATINKALPETPSTSATIEEVPAVTLETLEEVMSKNDDTADDKQSEYSRIPFIRFGQKVGKGLNQLFDWIVILPFSKIISAGKYTVWKNSGKEVFSPLQEVVKAYGASLPAQVTATTAPIETASKVSIAAAKATSLLDRFVGLRAKTNFGKIRNIPKSIYAPLHISTAHMPWSKKLMHILRHKRPNWYKRYHSYSFVHYLHLAILFIFVTATGFGFYQAFIDSPRSQKPALAQLPTAPPRLLSFQGMLTDVSNNPLTAATPLRFGIYNNQTATGSALVWQEVQTVTPDEDGVFSVLLGKNSPMSQSLFANNASLYLGITVGNDTELQPRQQLATVAYAANAETLQGLLPITNPNAGTTNVVLALDSSGNLTIGGTASPTFQATGGQFTLSGQTLFLTTNQGSSSNVVIAPDGAGIIDLQKPLQNTSNYNNIPSASGAVEVDDLFAILASSSGQSALTINQNSSGPIISASSGGTAKFTVSNTGAGTFANNLAVNGNSLTSTSTSFNIVNNSVTNLNIANSATSISIGASSGTTEINNNLEVNGNTTFGGQTYSWPSSQSNGAVLQTNGSGQLSWVTLGSITDWQINGGAVSPAQSTNDFLIGGNATSSAKFQVSGTTGNVSTTGNLIFNNTSSIQTGAAQTLTIGGNTTGSVVITPSNGGSLTLSNLGTGILHSSSGVISSSAINLASSDITGTLAVANGGTNTTSIGSAGSLAYSTGTAYGFTNIGTAGQCLVSGGTGAPTWATCPSNAWQETSGTISPNNSTLDFLVGGNSSESAKFAVLNMNSGTPTASISANVGDTATYITGAGVLGTTNAQTLTLGSSSTGNIELAPTGITALTAFSSGQIGIGTTSPLATLDIRGKSATTPVASISGQTAQAAFVIDNSGTGDLIAASTSGLTRFTVKNGGGINTNGEGLNENASINQFDGTVTKDTGLAFGTTFRTYAAQTGSSSVSLFSHYNNLEYAATSSTNQSGDLVASLDQVNWRGSGNSTGRLIGSIGKVVNYAGSGTIDTAIASLSEGTFNGGAVNNFYGIYARNPDGSSTINNVYGVYIENMNKGSVNNFALYAAGGKNYFGGNVGVGTTEPLAALDVRSMLGTAPAASIGAQTSFAALVVDNTGTGDLFSASSSGQTRFAIQQNGSTQIYLNSQIGSGGQRLCHSGADGSNQGLVTLADCNATSADYAEEYGTTNASIEAGDVVAIDHTRNAEEVIHNGIKSSKAWVVKSDKAYQSNILGIISTEANDVIGRTFTPGENPRPVALSGRVPVKISSSSAAIEQGDYITSSTEAGKAMKATKAGQILGKALETWTPDSGKTTIMIFVQGGWNDPGIAISDSGNISLSKENDEKGTQYRLTDGDGLIETVGSFAKATIANLTVGSLDAEIITAQSIAATEITINGKSLQEYILTTIAESIQNPANQMTISPTKEPVIAQLNANTFAGNFNHVVSGTNQTSSHSAIATLDDKGNALFTNGIYAKEASISGAVTAQHASISGTLRADKIIAGEIEGLELNSTTNITNIYNSIATPSATPTPAINESAIAMPEFNPDEVSMIKQLINSPLSPFNASSAAELNLDSLDVKDATISNDLNVLGRTTVNDLSVTGSLTTGVLAINGLDENGNASINTIGGNLKIQSTGVGGVDILAGKFTIDTKGNINVQGNATFAKDVTVKGKLKTADIQSSGTGKFVNLAANALKIVRGAQADTSATETAAEGSAGNTVIKANKTERTITSPHVTKESLIYITATSNTQGVMPYVARQIPEDKSTGIKGAFTIEIPTSVKKDIKINWWIVN